MQATKERGDTYAELLSRALSAAARALIDQLSDETRAWERSSGARARERHGKLEGFNTALEALVGDLLRAKYEGSVEGNTATGKLYRSLGSKRFKGQAVSKRTFQAVLRALSELGYVQWLKGRGHYSEAFGDGNVQLKGTASRFQATDKLIKAAEAHTVTIDKVHQHFRPLAPDYPLSVSAVSVRSRGEKIKGEHIAFEHTAQTDVLAADVRALNLFLTAHSVEIPGGEHFYFVRIFSMGNAAGFKWQWGGRLYSLGTRRSYQSLSGAERAKITIDGQPTVEIDVGASHFTAFHAVLRKPFDTSSDPYALYGVPRSVVKTWITISITQGKLVTKWSKQAISDFKEKYGWDLNEFPAKDVRAIVLKDYPALRHVGTEGVTWADLHYIESEALMLTLKRLMVLGIPALPVHDSVIVRLSDIEIATGTFFDSYKETVGLPPLLKTDSLLPGAKQRVEAAWRAKMGLQE